MNDELKQLFEEDQHDLRKMPHDRKKRDRDRRNRVKTIIDTGGATVAIDFIHAAIIFQHGEALEDWWHSYQLSLKAVELGFQPKWLAAVALDRWLLRQGKPLKYGNQVIPFGGVYRIPELDPNTTDEEREKWDVPSFFELYSFDKLRGFMKYDFIDTLENENLKVNIIKLERPPAHSPSLTGTRCGKTEDNRVIFENPYGWKWIEDSAGSFDLGWLLIPHVPVIAHIVATEGDASIERVTLNGYSCILVIFNNSKTLYFRTRKGIWALTGMDYNNITKKALIIQSCSS
ncbi:hypothetical protein [Litchfieldia salsa]|uniref:Uncharacterized protein n=1 Tax=Litchfieldia salsa TaxID=930152 RepID=A0A1H0TYI0_9BACI|nr:hypothetical protein [Litchfieldia salsa]SDP58820.1 hypothetical protein SAMN05216565_10417 [Litchfieldia salsa]